VTERAGTGLERRHPITDALVLHAADNVATALRVLQPGQTVQVHGANHTGDCVVHDTIALCHKFALRDIARGEVVVKYGESIGRASSDIRKGTHVHVHNLRSARAGG
jgi:altronate dehydratase small subunit